MTPKRISRKIFMAKYDLSAVSVPIMKNYWFNCKVNVSITSGVSLLYVLVIAGCSMQYGKYSTRSSHFANYSRSAPWKKFYEFLMFYKLISRVTETTTRLRSATLLKKRVWLRCFPVNFVKFLRTRFLQNTSGRLLLASEKTAKYEKQVKYLSILHEANVR